MLLTSVLFKGQLLNSKAPYIRVRVCGHRGFSEIYPGLDLWGCELYFYPILTEDATFSTQSDCNIFTHLQVVYHPERL